MIAMLPVAPLTDYLTDRGIELNQLFDGEEIEIPQATYPDSGWSLREEDRLVPKRRRVTDAARPAFIRWEKRIRDARGRGAINTFFADEFCCTLLNCHPCEVYGEAWFKPEVAA